MWVLLQSERYLSSRNWHNFIRCSTLQRQIHSAPGGWVTFEKCIGEADRKKDNTNWQSGPAQSAWETGKLPPECDSFGALSIPSKVGSERVVGGRRVLFPQLFSVRSLYTEGLEHPFSFIYLCWDSISFKRRPSLPRFPKQALSTS